MELYSRSKSENLKLFFNYSLVISVIRNFTQSELLFLPISLKAMILIKVRISMIKIGD